MRELVRSFRIVHEGSGSGKSKRGVDDVRISGHSSVETIPRLRHFLFGEAESFSGGIQLLAGVGDI